MTPSLSPDVERALELCGRDRVFHNDRPPFQVAIRALTPLDLRDKLTRHDDESWIVGKAEGPGEGHDGAGRRAALTFAARLRRQGQALIEWAEKIERALSAKGEGGGK